MDSYCQWRLSPSMRSLARSNTRISMVQALVVILCLSCATNVSCFQTKREHSSIRVTPRRFSLLSSSRPSSSSSSSSLVIASSAQNEAVPTVQIVSHMPEPLPEKLKNHYYLLRHGLSTANVAGIISSARSLAYSDKHGLTDVGYQQGVASANQLLRLLKPNSSQEKRLYLFLRRLLAPDKLPKPVSMASCARNNKQVAPLPKNWAWSYRLIS